METFERKNALSSDLFTETLFSWSLDNISDENLYRDKVIKIPESFESVKSYLGTYVYPLLEETRAQVFSSMEILDRSPFAEVIAFEETKPHGTRTYQARVDYWRNRFSDRSKEPYKTLPGDLLLLTNSKPESRSDLDRVGRSWALLSITRIADDDETDENGFAVCSTYFKVLASKEFEHEFEAQSSLFVVYLMNLIPNKRIWKALHMLRNIEILKDVLCINSVVNGHSDSCDEGSNFRPDSNLNESQNEAMLACLHNLHCKKIPSSFELIWGPPGTGKTKTTATLLVALLKMKVRTLICAPTNVAITEVASRVMKMLASEAEAEESDCSFGDILLFGNKDRLKLKVGSITQNIYLDYRVQKLTECVGPLGLNNSLTSMISFLEDCVPQYRVYVENELIKEKESEGTHSKVKSFIEYARKIFGTIAEQLQNCILIFCTHIPKSYFSEQDVQNMMLLTESLNCLNSILCQYDLSSEELEELFSLPEATTDLSDLFVDCNSLPLVKSSCLSYLRSLHSSLKKIDLPSFRNEDKIRSFCFQRASLVFCTVSSSFKLHQMEIAPMNVLVIDEAAQLKECESTIPLQLPGIKLAILVGDERQLPATVTSKICLEAGFGRSLFERLSLQNHPKHLLDVQYRMHPSISCFPNSKFYNNLIRDAQIVKKKSYEIQYLPGPMFGSYSFLNVIGGREEKDDDGHSRKNMVEVAIVLKIVQRLYKESRRELSVGIISPYAAQVVAIQEKLGKKYDELSGFKVKVKTVDGFQGGEDDIIIMSTVRSDHGRSLEFISNPQRVNVALTRARHCLWILGNERTLTGSQSIWGSLVINAKNRGCFFSADDDKDVAKCILEVKKELDQFDDLLNADSVLFKNSKWKVLFSDNFLNSFKKMKSVRFKKSVLNLLLKLSSGWRPKRPILSSGGGNSLEIMKLKVEGLYVLSTVDIFKDSKYVQVLKIWDILAPEDIPKLTKRLDGIFGKYTDEFINFCNAKSLEGNLVVPKSWPSSMELTRFKDPSVIEPGSDVASGSSDGRSFVENSRVSESLLLMKFYSLSYGVVNHLLSDRDGRELDLPFEVTDQEMEIILFPKSSFILGRSGTGKTTVLTMKLFQKEQLYHKAVTETSGCDITEVGHVSDNNLDQKSSSENKISVMRQLFVTVSPKLCYAIKKHVFDLKSFACGGTDSGERYSAELDIFDDEEDQFKNVPDSFVDTADDCYPLVVTFHKFLMMLDGTLSKSYFERFVEMSRISLDQRQNSRSVALQTFLRTKEVTFDKFSASYWPHFNAKLTKKIDSSRVFTEIISHIKGGPKAMDSSDLKLSREGYVSLSEGRSSSFSVEKREMIYDIYQMYEKLKTENGEFDLADFVVDLHSRLRYERYEGDQMDFVYIDEVQDLTMSQIALFKHICSNVEEGFVFAGDTAQTIARGIDFRFQDIRSLFYNRFLMGSKSEHGDRTEKGRVSEILSLSQNFRTHAGILKLSQSIVELLYHFFRHSVDILKPETSLISGEAPILLQTVNYENAIVKIFGSNANQSKKIVGFGAEQVILVRDDIARQEIIDLVDKQALVLTILECKGLEFQDVLLYNFFGSSPLSKQWRVIYEYMTEMDMFDSESAPNFPKFSEAKHNILCSELKQLYVAVTRTRQRLWICENTDFSDPMFDYWKNKCVVQVRQLDDSLAQAMQVASSPEEWRSRGIKLFHEKNYEWATVCFERAGDIYWERRSKASGLKAMAKAMLTSKPEEAKSLLREAAEIFESIGKSDSAAGCFVDLGEYERAGMIYLEKFGESELARAGECFSLAGKYELAAKVYARANKLPECLTCCVEGKCFDLGLEYIKGWKQNSTYEYGTSTRGEEIEKLKQEFLERCALYYHAINDKKSMMNFVRAFDSIKSARDFLNPRGCFDEIMSLEIESGNFVEAANMAKSKGDILLLIDLLEKARKFAESSNLILFYVLSKSLWSPGKGWPLKQFKQKDELLSKAKLFAKNESNEFYELVCVEADVMSSDESDLPMIMNQMVSSKKHNCVRVEILAARKLLEAHFSMKPAKFFREEDLVSDLEEYSKETMLKKRVTVESLVYFWDSWKENIVSVLEYLERLESHHEANEYKSQRDFCLNYLGLWMQYKNLNPVYLLLSSDADWARNVEKILPRNNEMLVSINARNMASCAKTYWCSEIISVGIKVLETLKSVYTHKPVSPFGKSKALTFIYQVADHLLGSKYLKLSHRNSETLYSFVGLAVNEFFGFVFPLDWQKSLTSSMIRLRGTEVSKILLKRFIATNFVDLWDLSYGKIGCSVMIILASGPIDRELYENIMKGMKWNPPWEAFLSCLCGFKGAGEISQKSREPDLIWRLRGALAVTLNVNMRLVNDYISPHCLIYLVESLINMAASIQGHFVTTRSSFVEWLVYQEDHSRPDPTSFVMPNSEHFFETICQFVISAIKDCLNRNDISRWIRSYCGRVSEHYSLLVTRMIVVICLLQANFGKCTGLLFNFLGRQEIAEQIPWDFQMTLTRGRNRRFLDVLSEALKKIDNPLVIVSLGGRQTPRVSCPHTVFVDMKVNLSKDEILRMLFPQSRVTVLPPADVVSTADSSSKAESSEIPCSNLEVNSRFSWDVFDELCCLSDGHQIGENHALKVKGNLEKLVQHSTVVNSQKVSSETPEEMNEFIRMADELKQLQIALDSREEVFTHKVSHVKELCLRLKSRRPTIEPILNRLLDPQVINSDGHFAAETNDVVADPSDELDCDVSATDEGGVSEMDKSEEKSDVEGKGKSGKSKKSNKPNKYNKKNRGKKK